MPSGRTMWRNVKLQMIRWRWRWLQYSIHRANSIRSSFGVTRTPQYCFRPTTTAENEAYRWLYTNVVHAEVASVGKTLNSRNTGIYDNVHDINVESACSRSFYHSYIIYTVGGLVIRRITEQAGTADCGSRYRDSAVHDMVLALMRYSAMSRCPFHAAMCRALHPSRLASRTSAPNLTSSLTRSRLPLRQLWCSAVCPSRL